jgi:dienelactone hydrolase
VKHQLKAACAAAQVRAEIEVHPEAMHGWCLPDSKAAYNQADA